MGRFEIRVQFQEDSKYPTINAVNLYRDLLAYGEVKDTTPNIFSGDEIDRYKIFKFIYESNKNLNWLKSELTKIVKEYEDILSIDIKEEEKIEEKRHNNYLRIEEWKINKLSNYIGELIIAKSNLMSLLYNLKFINDIHRINKLYKDFYHAFQNLDDVVFQLNEINLSIKMITFEGLFNKLIRATRELAVNKKIRMVISGSDTQIEKHIIDEISEPLLHIIRNAVDHGIETPEERIKKGKNEFGLIKVTAYSETDSVIIEISDDGKGIDIDKIKEKAIKKKMLSENELRGLSEKDIINFIFKPGFSTKDEITDISGRGVGMDVVKDSIERLNGLIDIKSKKDKGTAIKIKIPLSLSIIETLMIKFYNYVVSIPVSNIISTIKYSTRIIKSIGNRKVLLYNDEIIPLSTLEEVLNVNKNKISNNKYKYVILVGSAEKRLGLLIEDIINKEEVMIKSLNNFLGKINCVKGATILGDGKVSLIMDVKDIIQKFTQLRSL